MSRLVAWIALVVAVLSLALNLVLINRLEQARGAAVDALDRTSQRLDSLAEVTISYNARIQQTVPVSGEMPFSQTLAVPISTTVPINTTTNVSVNTLVGPLAFPVNVNTSVPIQLSVPVAISSTVPYSLTVPIDLNVPVQVRLRDLGVEALVQEMKQELGKLRAGLQ